MPPLLNLPTASDYRAHFLKTYVRGRVTTLHGIRVYFSAGAFDHAFFESTLWYGSDDQFSPVRAERMDWIPATLNDPDADWFQGWIRSTKRYDPARCAVVAYGDFAVVLRFRLKRDGTVVANFVTCYVADASIGKIRRAPSWTLADCRKALGG